MVRQARYGGLPHRLAALAIPCLAGLTYLAVSGAPGNYVIVNAAALGIALGWIVVGRVATSVIARRGVSIALLAAFAAPLVIGPDVEGVARWLTVGGFALHAGMLALPLLVVLAASDRPAGVFFLLAAVAVAFIQPDAASALALGLGALAAGWQTRHWKMGAAGVLGVLASVAASFGGELPPQPFVEGILPGPSSTSPLLAIALSGSLCIAAVLIACNPGIGCAPRFALIGALAGFVLAAIFGNYPTPLVGYGAASIFGMGLALARSRRPLVA